MDASTIALIGLFLAALTTSVGCFAYLTGEQRKSSVTARRDMENARDYLIGRIEVVAREGATERQSMRNDFVSSSQKTNDDLRRLSEVMVRRTDVDALEGRLVRSTERLEAKFDTIMTRRSRMDNNPGNGA